MKKLFLLNLLLIFAASCKYPMVITQLKQQRNASGSFILVYEGDQVNNQMFPRTIYLEDTHKRKTFFKPQDPVSVEQSAFYIQHVWSPSNDWLVLPNGRFDGFVTFKASDLPEGIVDKSKSFSIGVCDIDGTKWWHEFDGWISESVFRFKAGLSGELFPFEYNLLTGIVRSENPGITYRVLKNKKTSNDR